jgi:hypothetical protein
MSIRDPEVLEALRDQPELLAIADAVEDTQRLPRSPRRRILARAALVAAVGAAALLAVLLWPSGGKHTSVIDRASAAIGDGPVMHVVLKTPSGFQLVELDGDRTIAVSDEVEIWSDRSSKRAHVITRERGRVVSETLIPEDDRGLGVLDPAFTALWTGYRKALGDGTAKLIGKGSIYGHRVYWLQFSLPDHGPPGSRVAVDQDSYRPVAIYGYAGGSGFIHEQVLLARTQPFSDADFQRITPRRGSVRTSIPGRRIRLVKPWLTAGSSIRGLRLSSVGLRTVRTEQRRSRGVELTYGSRAGARWIQIDELKTPPDLDWLVIPVGFVKLLFADEPSAVGPTTRVWTGDLVVNGIYVRIETPLGRDALLAVARALKPV